MIEHPRNLKGLRSLATDECRKSAGRNCANFECNFWDDTGSYEQRCSAGDCYDDPYIEECQEYIPEQRAKIELDEQLI